MLSALIVKKKGRHLILVSILYKNKNEFIQRLSLRFFWLNFFCYLKLRERFKAAKV